MRKLTVELETVTPLLSYGAYTNELELRPTAFRGALRFWLRAALGGVTDDLDLIKKAEANVFGNTEGGGSVAIRVYSKNELSSKKYDLLPHHAAGKRMPIDGYDPGRLLYLTFTQQQGDEATYLAASKSLALLLTYGGVGRRSRRGFGHLHVSPTDTSDFKSNLVGSPDVIRQDALHAAKVLCETIKPGFRQSYAARYSHFSPTTIHVVSDELFHKWDAAIKRFGEKEHEVLQKNVLKDVLGSATDDRVASPLWVQVAKDTKDRYRLVLTLFDIHRKGAVEQIKAAQSFVKSFGNSHES
jgi:CRISPR-associated protein Cmr1